MTSRSQSSGLSLSRLKPPPLGSTSSSRWMVLASNPVASVIRLAARPVGAHSNRLTPLAARMRRIELTMVVLPTPGPPVMTSTFDKQGEPDRGDLTFGQRQAGLLLDPRQRLLRIDVGPGQRSIDQAQDPLGDDLLGPVEAGEEDAGRLADAYRR